MRYLTCLAAAFAVLAAGCAHVHHLDIGEIDNTHGAMTRVDLKSSATGVDIGEAARITKAASNSKTVKDAADWAEFIWKLITYGPKTGEVTFVDNYADELPAQLKAACPGGHLTGVASVRETNKYPVVSGEIVRLTAYCYK